MSKMGYGYGSECHLLRYLGRHRNLLDRHVCALTGADRVDWLDYHFDLSNRWPDGELTALDFLHPEDAVRKDWIANIWPQQGQPITWYAVARIRHDGISEWLLLEAKANIQELMR